MKIFLIAIMFIAVFSGCKKDESSGKLDPNSLVALNPGVGVKSDNPEHCTAGQIVEWTFDLDVDAGTRGFSDRQRDYVNNRLLMHGFDIIENDGSLVYEFFDTNQAILTRRITTILDKTYYYPHIEFQLDPEKRLFLVGIRHDLSTDGNSGGEFEKKDEIQIPEDYIFSEDEKVLGASGGSVFNTYGGKFRIDTIAYVPKKILREAADKIKSAYEKADYAACYELFDKAFSFYPITGQEWRVLKEQGIE